MEVTEKEVKRREEEGLMADKLKRRVLVGLRGGPSTPPPTWRLELSSSSHLQSGGENDDVREFVDFTPSTISARKLCANVWELQPHHLQVQTSLPNMTKPVTRIRRRRRRRRKDEHPQRPTDEPASPNSLSRHVVTLPVQSHRSCDRDGCILEPLSSASYSGSLEVAPYNQAVTPVSSFNFKGRRMGESSCNVKTSRELLKVLNRICSLEEHHASSISVVQALKMELDLSRARVKELLQEKQMDRQGTEHLMKKMTEDQLVRKNLKEFDKIKAAFQSAKEELEDERRLRKHSESMHRKLARELSQTKSSLSGSLRELERERKARILLENLCDEFAKGIRAYEQEVRSLGRLKSEKGHVDRDHSLDRLILHISEAWLDERVQMKLAKVGDDLEERSSIVDKLGFDIETFLHATRSIDSKRCGHSSPKELKEIHPCRHSLDSFPLKEATSAPQNMAEEDSICANFSVLKSAEAHLEERGIGNSATKPVQAREFTESSHFQENMAQKNMSRDEGHDSESWPVERKPSEIRGDTNTALLNDTEVSTVCESTPGPQESVRPRMRSMNSIHRLDNVVGNSSMSSEGDKIHPESICREDSFVQSVVTGNGSPVEQRKSKLSLSNLNKCESILKLPRGVKENTLMAKLLEARLEGQKSRSRTSKSSFRSTREISDDKIGV
ncbi:uncharacterized protein At5g41620-like isoform X2 [Prosopis cineraria]|uniref:uncharacterized protein At5g41620-like isoform X2 n=1 Tax=Prosopis cineraria TaxID=364024 RepID=UPI0024108F7B|nr:uncharacterized protein At5g41620-like isoform X2 [Prosopis cineraria]